MKHLFFSYYEQFKAHFTSIEKSTHNNDIYYWIKIEHINVNTKLGIDDSFRLFSHISFGIDDYVSQNTNLVPIQFYINFGWYDEETNTYPMTLPNNTRILETPQNIEEHNSIFWDIENGIFINNKNRIIDIMDYCKKKYKKHIKPMHFTGILMRITRFFLWITIPNILSLLIALFSNLFKAFSGKGIVFKEEEYRFNYLYNKDAIIKYSIEEGNIQKINLLGIEVNIIPAITYSIIHLLVFSFFFIIGSVPVYFSRIGNNSFLIAIYTIVSYFLMNFGLSKICILLSKLLLSIKTTLIRNKTPIREDA